MRTPPFRLRYMPLVALLFALFCFVGCATTVDETTEEINAALELGGLYLAEGNFDKAIEIYDRGLEVHSENEKLLYNKTAALIKANRFDEAAALAEAAYRQHPHLLRFAKAQATSLELAGKGIEAIPAWEEIVSLDPADTTSRIRLMNLLVESQRYDDATAHAWYLLERKSADADALKALAVIDQSRGGNGEPWISLVKTGFPAPLQSKQNQEPPQ